MRVTTHLTRHQLDALRVLAAQRGTDVAVLIRAGVDCVLTDAVRAAAVRANVEP